ncbi:YfiR family protein [Xenorhabdus sp. XENO-10]|uniref:YfiR family protein n=1 Tax=Xenorhabdus yunnanensis TaxID=3025878 RepID=A0ABT5LB16_9GAMM|nr:YfiR family protein [Xenorhabdus yunnanensis]MDC9588247.1 YfiR family protein [Xenorhabdus yunnanensis]
MSDTNQKLKRDEENVVRVVSGILSYTHWPTTPTTLRLCLVPPSNYINALTHINKISEHIEIQVETLNFNVEQLDAEQLDVEQIIERCDVIYYGQVDPQLQHQVIDRKNDKPLLTIAENNPSCEIGSAFCLNINSTQATFSLNLDILTRSGVRVHPNVLQLARKVE